MMDNKSISIEKITESRIKKSKSISELTEYDQILRSRIENGSKVWIWFIGLFLTLSILSIISFLGIMCSFIVSLPDINSSFSFLREHNISFNSVTATLCVGMMIFFGIIGFRMIRSTLKLALKDNKLITHRKRLRRQIQSRVEVLQNKITLELGSLSYTTKKFLKEKGVI